MDSPPASLSNEGYYFGLGVIPPITRQQLPEARMFPYKDATPCNSCKTITVEALISTNGHLLHTIAEAILAASNGCELCFMIVSSIDQLDEIVSYAETITMMVANVTGTPYCQDQVLVVGNIPPTNDTPRRLHTVIGVYTDEGNIAGDLIPGRRLARFPDPDASIQLAKSWIEQPAGATDEGINELKVLPKRFIDVGSMRSATVILKDFPTLLGNDDARMGRYVCLSHRWDSTSSLHITTTATLAARKCGIDLVSLPPTFQDAINVTRALGLQYIWIDCLCILQDSKTDWEEESAKMGTYYSSSWLTIAAGVESSKGLFGNRDVTLDRLEYFRLNLSNPKGSTLYFTNELVNTLIGDEQRSILRQRAWAFQEEVLSPRYLGFQPNQMYYRCGEYITFETGYKEWLYPPESLRGEGELPLDPSLLQDNGWLESFVSDYSSRCLTVGDDVLPALSGVAHEYQRHQGSHYHAGLWQDDLPRDLCWTKKFNTVPHTKPTMYRAPSWSWAAIDGRVSPTLTDWRGKFEAEIIHIYTKLKGIDPMGEVVGGTLVIHGVLKRGTYSEEKVETFRAYERDNVNGLYDFHLTDSGNQNAITYTFCPDASEFSLSPSTGLVWILFITAQVGLALLPVADQESQNTFQRVGLISMRDDTPFQLVPTDLEHEQLRTTINII